MEASSTIRKMMAGNRILVPSYQRAYSWETPQEKKKQKSTQTDVFLNDLEEYSKSNALSSYYFGHFLFEENEVDFAVIDGQQRLTTIVIFLSALFEKLRSIRELTENEEELFEDMIQRGSKCRFATVDYDNPFFKDYVIKQVKKDKNGLETESAKRIARAFDFFKSALSEKPEDYLTKMLSIVSNSKCTTHPVKSESEAIQMFIFQNNRGKKPSNLEVVKAQFMYNVHLFGGEDKEELIGEIKERFEKIYKSISSIEYKIDEDEVLLHTLKVFSNSLWEKNALEKIGKRLSEDNPIQFIENFTHALSLSFEHLSLFFGADERNDFAIHSLVSLGGIGIALPFILKAYKFNLESQEVTSLCESLEHLVLRHKLIGTRADMTSRINKVFETFTEENPNITPIINRVEMMKTTNDWWWAYWSNDALEKSLQGGMKHSIAKYLLWKYETHLKKQGKNGYSPTRFNGIEKPELEHIAPSTEPSVKPHGYGEYNEEFKTNFLNCIGNYLLLSKSHNCSIGNVPFKDKWKSYCHNEQQREVQRLVSENGLWDKFVIQERKQKIISYIVSTC